jgi:hypothetical protein
MFHDDWRIRNSSVSLLGELLYLIGDTKAVGLADGEDDDDGCGGFTSSTRVVVTIRSIYLCVYLSIYQSNSLSIYHY